MRTVEEHLDEVLSAVLPLSPLPLHLLDARGCVLAQDLVAHWSLPRFDNSAMDGYAVRATDVAAAGPSSPVRLPVVADVAAGASELASIEPGQAARVMTGAPMPVGADAVVPVESSDGGTEVVELNASAAPGAYVRRAGEDVAEGDTVLSAGAVIGPRQVALIAAAGYAEVLVHPRPRVVVLSTGDELVAPGVAPGPGQIADSNSLSLSAAVREVGATAYRVGPIADDAEQLVAVLSDQLVRADVVITTGGVSMGAYDIVKEVLGRTGTVDFLKVAMQPGMPQGFGLVGPDRTPLFALPGNPVSAYVSFEVFVRPALRRMMGHVDLFRPVVRARCLGAFDSPAGKRTFARAVLATEAGAYTVRPAIGQGSHMLRGLSASNALIVVAPETTNVAEGDSVVVMSLDGGPL